VEFQKEKEKYIEELERNFSDARQVRQEQLLSLDKEIENKKEFNNSLLEIREKELNSLMEEKKKTKELQIEKEIEEWAESAQEAANEFQRGYRAQLQLITDAAIGDMQAALKTLEEYKEKRDAINQEILRSRALEEKQDFYRIQLDENSIRDIQILEEIKPRLSKFDSLDKLIYDIYVKKVADEMIKRVLEGRAPSGIYKITRLKTGEIYIGKSTDVKARWQQHSKSVFHCGTISHSILHTTMEKDGIENFTWELLEEVPKDKLGEREKYWIEFYDSKNYGLNERVG
jgi:predicted GIY-YIG superfamily endonuclease